MQPHTHIGCLYIYTYGGVPAATLNYAYTPRNYREGEETLRLCAFSKPITYACVKTHTKNIYFYIYMYLYVYEYVLWKLYGFWVL